MQTFNFLRKILLLLLLTFWGAQSFAQTCIPTGSDSDMKGPFSNILTFDGDNSYGTINSEGTQSSTSNAGEWLDNGPFTFDTWVKCVWPDNEDSYVVLSCGKWATSKASIYVYFQNDGGQYYLRVTDGIGVGNSDIAVPITYLTYYKDKWKHIAVTFDGTTIKLYVDGTMASQSTWVLNDIAQYAITMGDNTVHSDDFRGNIATYRIWSNIAMTPDEILYIKDRNFYDQNSFTAARANLYNKLKFNLWTPESAIKSTVPATITMTGTTTSTTEFNPAKPPH